MSTPADRIALVGEAPTRETEGREPLSAGRTGRRFAELAGLPPGRLAATFDVFNVLGRWPGKAGEGKGDAFPPAMARNAALELARGPLRGRRAIVLGFRAARAFGRAAGYFDPFDLPFGGRAVAFPHPSGINRWWNDPDSEPLARRFLATVLAGDFSWVPEGDES